MAAGSAGGSVGGTTGGGVTGGGVTGGPAKTSRPILLLLDSVNQRLSSAPTVMPMGPLRAVGTSNLVISPVGVICPILLPEASVNQRLPSGPAVMPVGPLSEMELDAGGNS